LKALYPEHKWEFVERKPAGYWAIRANQKAYLDDFAEKFQIKTLDEWYNITTREFIDAGGAALLTHYKGSLIDLLRANYPHHKWRTYSFSKPHHLGKGISTSKGQLLLHNYLKEIFSDQSVSSIGGLLRSLYTILIIASLQYHILLNQKHPDLYYPNPKLHKSRVEYDVSPLF
jgi:hypothetical protein